MLVSKRGGGTRGQVGSLVKVIIKKMILVLPIVIYYIVSLIIYIQPLRHYM